MTKYKKYCHFFFNKKFTKYVCIININQAQILILPKSYYLIITTVSFFICNNHIHWINSN